MTQHRNPTHNFLSYSRSYDHVEILGDTLEAIAWQKAGIIKAGRPALTAETQVGALVGWASTVWVSGPTNTRRTTARHAVRIHA